MATQLLKLRYVPEDELIELRALLEQHEIDFYETSAGNWGISMPALWLSRDEQIEQAQTLLNEYNEQRFLRVRTEYDEKKKSGESRSILDMVKENPLQFVIYIMVIGALLYFSTVPFIHLGSEL